MKVRRLALAPEHLCVRLVSMLLLGIPFISNISCDVRSAHYSHEIVIPQSLTAKGGKDPGQVSYMLFMQGQKQLVHLKVKRGYSVDNFPVYSYHNGTLRQEMPFSSHDCHYEGYIEGVPGSFVSVDTCSGLRGVLVKEETSYGIEPMVSSERFEHVLYTMAHQGRVSCSVTSKNSQGDARQRQRSRKPQHVQETSFLWSHTKYVEMFVVVNNQRFRMWGSNISETVRAVVDIIALVNSFTRAINTEVVLAGLEIWTEGDLIEVPVDLRVTLRNFNRWRQEKLLHRVRHDVAHMIVGHHPGEDTGQAFVNGACSSGFAAAVESFHHEDVLLFAALVAHELGHNLGIQHDHEACTCEERRFCLMHANITKHSGFSNCSSDFYYHFLHEHRGACLLNRPWRPSRQRRDARCGNGVVEPPEQCDCGSACDDHPCCEPTCQLKTSARCSDGLCCHRCDFKRKGVLCRPVQDECDLPEYCNGSFRECPADSYKQDGTLCDRIYYCSGGQCKNPDKQCSKIYGFPARSAPEECYISINTKRNRFGNCGHGTGNNSEYVVCADDNVFCGKLICTGVAYLPPVKPQHTLIQISYEDDWCWSMDAYSTVDIPDYGDVQNGTYCAPNKVCMGNTCTDYTVAQYDCEPQGMCHGKGVCNNLQHCHCDEGFAPPDCKKPGNGGSVDSGPAGKPGVRTELENEIRSLRGTGRGHGYRGDEISYDQSIHNAVYILPLFLLVLFLSLIIITSFGSRKDISQCTENDLEENSEVIISEQQQTEN
uniref:disintegrin and metalloproteinase domain-containing protein 1a-like n=1 Tax=Jaculus jaculus TaxID=51337 RepID=UPI001E1AF8A0|nr:disintegrin and metalloproteinase domain-containing protein 1a-like [Jaculus jaculus]